MRMRPAIGNISCSKLKLPPAAGNKIKAVKANEPENSSLLSQPSPPGFAPPPKTNIRNTSIMKIVAILLDPFIKPNFTSLFQLIK